MRPWLAEVSATSSTCHLADTSMQNTHSTRWFEMRQWQACTPYNPLPLSGCLGCTCHVTTMVHTLPLSSHPQIHPSACTALGHYCCTIDIPLFQPSPPTTMQLMAPTWSSYGAISSLHQYSILRATLDDGNAWTQQNALLTPPPPSWLLWAMSLLWSMSCHCSVIPQFMLTMWALHWAVSATCLMKPIFPLPTISTAAWLMPPMWSPHGAISSSQRHSMFNIWSHSWQQYLFPVSFLQHFLLLTSVNLAYDKSNSLYLDTSIELNSI